MVMISTCDLYRIKVFKFNNNNNNNNINSKSSTIQLIQSLKTITVSIRCEYISIILINTYA